MTLVVSLVVLILVLTIFIMIDLMFIDFATWDNARWVARADVGDEISISGWVIVFVRGISINYHIADDFAYCVVTDRELPILSDFKWEPESDRFEFCGPEFVA